MAYDAAFGENHFFPDLQRLVPTRLAQGAGDEFFADVPFAEATSIHFRRLKPNFRLTRRNITRDRARGVSLRELLRAGLIAFRYPL